MAMILSLSRATALAAVVLLLSGCTGSAPAGSEPTPREASKVTCDMPRLTRLPSGLEARDRKLVPLSPTLLGVEESFDDGARRSVIIISGGYLDDVLEAYDDLAVVDRLDTDVGRMTMLEGTLLEDTVRVAYWRAADATAPCDVRAVFGVNVAEAAFTRMLVGLR